MTNPYVEILENLYDYFYKEMGDMERSTDYEHVVLMTPKVKELWEEYKEAIESAKIIFEYRFKKLIDRHK